MGKITRFEVDFRVVLYSIPHLCFMNVSPCWLSLEVMLLPWKSNSSRLLRVITEGHEEVAL